MCDGIELSISPFEEGVRCGRVCAKDAGDGSAGMEGESGGVGVVSRGFDDDGGDVDDV